MTTNKPEVYRVLGHRLHDDGPIEKLPYDWIRVIRLSDYERLQAECDHYKSATVEITTHHFVERWVNAASDKELEQCLSDGIAQLEGEYRKQIGALQAECERWKNAAHGAHRQLTASRLETEKLAVDWGKAMAECDKLRNDAERYRWLRAIGGRTWTDHATQKKAINENFDAAIDAAKKETNP